MNGFPASTHRGTKSVAAGMTKIITRITNRRKLVEIDLERNPTLSASALLGEVLLW